MLWLQYVYKALLLKRNFFLKVVVSYFQTKYFMKSPDTWQVRAETSYMKVAEMKVQSGPCTFLLISVEGTPVLTQPENHRTTETLSTMLIIRPK